MLQLFYQLILPLFYRPLLGEHDLHNANSIPCNSRHYLNRIDCFSCSRITNANGSSCFISVTNNIDTIFEYMAKLGSNLILCELPSIDTYKNEQTAARYDLKLFGRECVIIQIKRLKFHPKLIPTADTPLYESANILFFAFTSGTCGESKLIGVTQKCFVPNILSLG